MKKNPAVFLCRWRLVAAHAPLAQGRFLFVMYICYGASRNRIPMDGGKEYTLEKIVVMSSVHRENGEPLHLEYHPNLYHALTTTESLLFACEMVVGYHDHLRSYSEVGMWGEPDVSWVDKMCGFEDEDDFCDDVSVAAVVRAQTHPHNAASSPPSDSGPLGPPGQETVASLTLSGASVSFASMRLAGMPRPVSTVGVSGKDRG